jgi:prepilin-type N-terminal cleavage/methylation domain-containing protein
MDVGLASPHSSAAWRPRPMRGFTLIEVLVVIAILSALMAILLPTLRQARMQSGRAKCLANLQEILRATMMYDSEQGAGHALPWYQTPPHKGYDPSVITPWVFGGFRAPNPRQKDVDSLDSCMYPAQVRPLNAYIAPLASADAQNQDDRGRDIIKSFICPGDRTSSTALIGPAGDNVLVEEENYNSWEANGSSYSLNTRFMQGYEGNDFRRALADKTIYAEMSSRIARHLVGGSASRFIMWVEQGFYSATYNAGPTLDDSEALPQRTGWHRRFSSWSVGFADGHAVHGYYDTRLVYGLDGTIWQPGFKPLPPDTAGNP